MRRVSWSRGGLGVEQLGDLVGLVHEGEDADPGELFTQGVDQKHGEAGEARDRARDIAQENEIGAAGARLAGDQVDRDAAGGHGFAHGLAQIDLAAAGAAAARGQAGGQHPGQPLAAAAQFVEFVLGDAQEVGVLGLAGDAVGGDALAADALGDAAAGLGLDGAAEVLDALARGAAGDLGVESGRIEVRVVHALGQSREDLADQQFGLEILERLVGGARRPARGLVLPHLLDHLRGQLLQLLRLFAGRILDQQLRQHLPQFENVHRAVGLDGQLHFVGPDPLAQRGREPQVEHAVEGGALGGAAQQRAGQTLAQRLPVHQVQHGENHSGVHGCGRSNRNSPAAQRFHEPDQMALQSVLGRRPRHRHRLGGRPARNRPHGSRNQSALPVLGHVRPASARTGRARDRPGA